MIGFNSTYLQVSFVSFEPHAIAITDRASIARVGELVQHLVTNANLADVAKETGLVKHMSFLNPKIKEGTNEHVLGTVVEALLGAIHEDSGKDMEAVRRAMHLMGLSLPKWYMAKSRLYQHESQDARAELEQYDLRKTGLKQYQRGLQKARIELNQIDLRSQPKQSDLQQAKSEMHRIVTQKQEPAKKPGRRERRRVSESLHKPQEKVDRGLSRHKNSDEESFGYRYQITEGQATSDEDLEALDGNPVRTYDLRINEESCEDYDAEHAVLEDANNQAHLRDQDADQTGLETPATHHESIETRTARFTSSSWRELMRGSDNSQRELKNAPRQKAAKPPATDFDRALRAMMLEENDGFPTEHELEGGKKWPVRHGWFPQRCQITLDVALSKDSSEEEEVADCEPNKPPTVPKLDDATLMKDPDAKEEVAACKPDSLLATSSLDDVAPSEIPETTKKVAAYEPDRMPVASTLDDVALSEPDSKEGVAFRELNRLLAPPTLDDIALPELSTMKEVAAYEPDRLRLIVAPSELDRLMTAL